MRMAKKDLADKLMADKLMADKLMADTLMGCRALAAACTNGQHANLSSRR
jgi:hypothetical protein